MVKGVMRDRFDEVIALFGAGRSSFAETLSDLRALRAEAGNGEEYGLLVALQQAIDDRLIPFGLACSLHQAVHAAPQTQAQLPPAGRIGASDIERLIARFRRLRRPPASNGAAGSIGQVLRSRFVLDAEIGRGGMGVVYRAVDRRRQELDGLSPYVAIKLLGPEIAADRAATRILEAEARHTQDLAHPNIVAVHDFDREGAHAFVVMEHLVGKSLDVMLSHRPDFAGTPQAHSALLDLLAGLAHAHQQGVAHADLKPANLFICADGRLKILDFGIASVPVEDRANPSLERAVTPAYASPERLAGAPRSPRDDVYALGCLIHILLAGRHPFNRLSASDAKTSGLAPPALEALPSEANEVVARALAFDAAQRPADAAEVQKILRKRLSRGLSTLRAGKPGAIAAPSSG